MTNKVPQQSKIKVDTTSLKIEPLKESTRNLEFKQIAEIINSTFKIQNPRFEKVYQPLEAKYYTLIDSAKVKSFRKYSEFLILEFENVNNSENEFKKIKLLAKKWMKGERELLDYYGVYSKGGISFNRVDNWIIGHLLRCNMYPKDYEIDKKFTSKLEKLDVEVDWIRSYCGWTKMEIK